MKDLKEALARRAGILGALLLLPTIGGFFGGLHWTLDLLAHFRLQYALLGLLLTGLSLSKRSLWTSLAGAATTINVALVAQLYLQPSPPTEHQETLTVMTFNLHTTNTATSAVAGFLESSEADVIFLLEVDQKWLAALKEVEGYTLVEARPSADNFGIAALARRPVLRRRVLMLSDAMVPSIELTVSLDDQPLKLLGTHPVPPMSGGLAALRDQQLARLGTWARTSSTAVVIAGDLNTTVWSTAFGALLQSGQLQDSARGYHPTWPSGRPLLLPFSVPIDHVLTRGLQVLEHRVGAPHGSDHRPVIVRLTR